MTFAQFPSPQDPTRYAGPTISTMPAVSEPRAPTITDRNYPLFTIWRNSNRAAVLPDNEGDAWLLVKFQSPSSIPGELKPDAIWQRITTGSVPGGTVVSLSDTAATTVFPDGLGNIQLVGGAGINVVSNPPSNLLTFSLAGGGIAVDQIAVDAHTAPGTDPVVADGTGEITITGAQVASGVVGANVIRTDSLAANALTIEVQRSNTSLLPDSTLNGVSHFSSTAFTVDASGFVDLPGGGQAAENFKPDVGADVIPSPVTGTVILSGQNPASQNGIETYNIAASEMGFRMKSPFTVEDFTFQNTAAATPRTLTVNNTDTNAASSSIMTSVVAAASTADPYYNCAIATSRSYAFGIDNSDSDSLKITTAATSTASPSSATIFAKATTAGEWTYPLQPAFLTYASGTLNNVTGDGTDYTIVYDTEIIDQNNDFDGTSTFTAPVTGFYNFNTFNGVAVSAGSGTLEGDSYIATSNRNYNGTNLPTKERVANFVGINAWISFGTNCYADMDAADTATSHVEFNLGTKTTSLIGNANMNVRFSGKLVC